MRLETATARTSVAHRGEIANYVAASAVNLAHIASASVGLSDELKRRVRATFLTLINLRESLDRAAGRWVPSPGAVHSMMRSTLSDYAMSAATLQHLSGVALEERQLY